LTVFDYQKIKSKNTMPEIKPVEPDPDNAGVGNRVCKIIVSEFMGNIQPGLCKIL
jgi:hypothetical protein